MYAGIHNYSEIGKLNKVLLHRPGEELEALTPSTIERLLFDDIPFLKVAQQEHDAFAQILRDNGTEVVYKSEPVKSTITTIKYDGITCSNMTWAASGEVSKAPMAIIIKDGAYTSVE